MTNPLTDGRRDLRTVDARHVAGLADLLGAEDVDTSPGAPLPALWHWAALAQWPPTASLGPDGHPADDGLPRRADLPRRMFAGGEVTVRRPLRIGAQVEVRRTVEEVRDTQGRSGALRFVTVRDTIHDDPGHDDGAGPAVEERLDLVYRATAVRRDGAAPEAPPDEEPAGLRTHAGGGRFVADAPALMRFSALTCNAHRIHYDRTWATLTEGYDDLVVHGPLLAVALAEVARRAGGPLRSVVHRGSAPLLRGQVADLTLTTARAGGPGDDTVVRAHRPTDGEPRLLSSVTVHHQLEETP